MWFYLNGDGSGHIQSLVIGGALLVLGALVAVMGMLADLITANRKLLEATLHKVRKLEEQLAEREDDRPKPEELRRHEADDNRVLSLKKGRKA